MAFSILQSPDLFALTKGGRMHYLFLGNARTVNVGVKAVNQIAFTNCPDGYAFSLTWNGRTYTYTARTSPSLDTEFQAGNGSSAYVDSLLAYFKSRYEIREDFVVTRSSVLSLQVIVLTAKQAGPNYNVTPFTGISTDFATGISTANLTAGVLPVVRAQYGVHAELWLEKMDGSAFERIFESTLEADDAGQALFDVGSLLHAQLSIDWPNFLVAQPNGNPHSGRRYYVAYGEAYGSPQQIGRIQQTDTLYAYYGGADYLHQAGSGFSLVSFLATVAASQDWAMRYGPTTRYVLADEPQFLTFLNTRADAQNIVLEVSLTYDNNALQTRTDVVAPTAWKLGSRLTMPAGPAQLGLAIQNADGANLREYSVRLRQSGTTNYFSTSYRYILNYDYKPYTRYFAYESSLGCVDSLCTFGKGSAELERFNQQAERFLPSSYLPTDGQFVDYDVTIQQQVEVTTGFRDEAELKRWNDFYRSPNRQRIKADGTALPISIISKSIKQAKDGDTQFAHLFQYAYAYQDAFYTGEQSLDTGDVAPPPNFTPAGGQVVIAPTVTLFGRDNSVPQAARDLTPAVVTAALTAESWGNHADAGYINQQLAASLFVGKPFFDDVIQAAQQPGAGVQVLVVDSNQGKARIATQAEVQALAGSTVVRLMPVPDFSIGTGAPLDDTLSYLGYYPNPGDNDNPDDVVTFQAIYDLTRATLVIGQSAVDLLNQKVDKLPGKGLSTNDFTDLLKTKLDALSSGAKGDKGDKGDGGTQWITTTQDPATIGGSIGNVLDFCLNKTTGDVFERMNALPNNTPGTWQFVINLLGPRGAQGNPGSGGGGASGVTYMPVPNSAVNPYTYLEDFPAPNADQENDVVTWRTLHDVSDVLFEIIDDLHGSFDQKVTAVPGKGLSTHDLTDALYTKLVNLPTAGVKGDKGDPGQKGEKGDTGAVGPVGPAGSGIAAVSTILISGPLQYAPILFMPISTEGTYDHSILRIGLSAWGSEGKKDYDVSCSARNGFGINVISKGDNTLGCHLVAYQQANATVLYILADAGFDECSVTYLALVQSTGVAALNFASAVPPGTLVYDSRVNQPDLAIGSRFKVRQINSAINLATLLGWEATTGEVLSITPQLLANLIAPLLPTGGTTTPVVPFIINVDTYNSTTGVLTMKSTGGGADTVQYRIPNLTDWQTSPAFTLPDNQRDGSVTFTIEGRAGTRTNSVTFTPYLPTASAWLGKVAVMRDVNSHGYAVMAEGLNCPAGVNLSITRTDGIVQSGTSSGVNWQTGTARQMVANNDATYKLFEAFYPGAGGPGLTPGYSYLLLFTNLATQETKTFSDYFSPAANTDTPVVLQPVISDPTSPVTPTDPVTPTPGNPYDYTYTISDTRTDSTGTPFTRTTAPVYAEVVNDHPVAPANQYPYIDQKAKGVAFWGRFAPFSVDTIMLLWGAWYNVSSANNLFERGIAGLNSWPNWRQGPTDTRNLPAERKCFMYDDDNCRAFTQIVMNQYGSGDPRYGIWDAFKNGRSYSDPGNPQTQPAFKAIGAAMWNGEKTTEDAAGRGVKYMSYDLESTPNNYQFNRHCIGWMYQGYIDAAAADGLFPILFMYGQFQFLVNIYDFSDTQVASGFPQYVNLSEQGRDILGDIDPSLQAVNQSGGTISMDGYFQGIWGYEPLLKRNADKSLILSGGKPQYNDILQTTAYGQTLPLQGPVAAGPANRAFNTEADRFVSDLYRHAGRLFCQWYFIAGGYPETSASRRAGLEKSHVGAIGRPTNEGDGIAGMTYNSRPLPLWQMEVQTILDAWHSVGGGVNAMWGSDMNQPPTTPGTHPATNSPVWEYNAHGVMEGCIKGIHRYSQFRSIRTGVCRFGWANFDVQDHNNIDGQYPWQKSIKRFRFWGTGDNQYIEVLIINPLLDNTSNSGKLWINQNGHKSLAYTLTVTDGREGYFYDCWKLPTGFGTVYGKDVLYQEPDILGVLRTVSLDYRYPVTGNPAPPADFVPTGTTAPTTPFSVSGNYNRTTHKLILAGANAVGSISYNIPGVTEGYAGQPTDGFEVPASLRDGTQTLNIAARTASNQAAQTTISIPADIVPTGNITQSYLNLGRIGLGLYNETPNPRQYGSNPIENREPFEHFGLQNIPKSDETVLAYMTLIRQIKEAHSASDKLIFYSQMLWSYIKCGANVNSTWARGNLSAPTERLMQNQLADCVAHGHSMVIELSCAREQGFREYLADSERVVDHNGTLSDFAQMSPAPWQFARLQPGFNPNSIPTDTAAGKCLTDWKDFLHLRKADQVNGSLAGVMPTLNDNGEFAYTTGSNPQVNWYDWSPNELSDLRAYLQTIYASIGALNNAWGTGFGDWNQVTYRFTGDFRDFGADQRGIDCSAFRTKRLGDVAEVYARLIWSELPGVVIIFNFGQSIGGQGAIVGNIDPVYILQRAQAVAAELGYTFPCVSYKINPESSGIDYKSRASYTSDVNIQACGYSLPMMEYTLEYGAGIVNVNEIVQDVYDFLRYGYTGKSTDTCSIFMVLFNQASWTRSGGVSDALNALFSKPDRLQPIYARGPVTPEKMITTTIQQILFGLPNSGDYPWYEKLRQSWVAKNGLNEYVKMAFTGLGLPVVVTQPTSTCVPMSGGTLGGDSTVTQNSELVISFDGLSGSTNTLQFTWIESNGVVVVQGGGSGDFAVRLRFPNVGVFTVTAKAQNACGSVTRSVNITVPAPVDPASTQPYFDVSVDQPVLQGNGTYSQAIIHLNNLKNATRYKIFVGDVTDNNQDFFTDVTGTSASFTEPAPASGASKKFTVRFWNGTDTAHWADRSFTITSPATAPTQYIVAIQTKRTPGMVNANGIQLRVQTAGGYVPKFAYSKTGFPVLSNSSGDVPAFQQGSYQYGTIISDAPNSGAEYITVGFLDSAGHVAQILISDKSGTDSDWITQYPQSF